MHDSAQYVVAVSIVTEELTACNTRRPNPCKKMVYRRPIYGMFISPSGETLYRGLPMHSLHILYVINTNIIFSLDGK